MSNKYLVEGSTSELTTKTAAELAGLIHSREVTSREVTQAHLDRINEVDGEIHAFLHVGEEAALAAETPSIRLLTPVRPPHPHWPAFRWRSKTPW